MTYYGGKELAEAFRKVRKNTIQIAEDIPEDKYGFKPSPESRSIGQTLAHMATATTFAAMLESLKDDAFFGEVITFRPGAEPPSRTRFDLLLAAKEHEMHHRAQLMVMERMIGIVPHLTREAQARMARFQAQQAQATR